MTSINRQLGGVRDVVTVAHGGVQDVHIEGRAPGDSGLTVLDDFPPADLRVVTQFVFGGRGYRDRVMEKLAPHEWPILWVQGDSCSGAHLAGMQAFAVGGTPVRRLRLDKQVVGSAWSDSDADYCMAAGLLPADLSLSRPEQTRNCFERMEEVLALEGMRFSHVVRTWLFLERLLDWYGEFNTARTTFFRERGVFDRLVPASTGIGGSNPQGAALVSGFLAIRPKHANVRIEAVASPLQCPALDYQSSFSRAVELGFPDRRKLIISGTASIAPGGESLYRGDIDKQIDLTLDVIEAILVSRGMTWADTTRMIAYFLNMSDYPRLAARCAARGIAPLPVAPAHAVVCRDDLLFEAELDAEVAVS